MFTIGDFAVCPGHGVGQIYDIESKKLGEHSQNFYIVKLTNSGLKIFIPINGKNCLRKLACENEIAQVFSLLSNHNVEIDKSTWNRRYREYMDKIKTGSLLEIAYVLRSLLLLQHKKCLSFGEKKLLNLCKDLLVQEIAISKGEQQINVNSKIDSIFQ